MLYLLVYRLFHYEGEGLKTKKPNGIVSGGEGEHDGYGGSQGMEYITYSNPNKNHQPFPN
jgi:hypothetical protein